jgi:single-stranded-DNA-specific exonuclease
LTVKKLFTPEWVFPGEVEIPQQLRQEIGGSEIFLQMLVRRGFTDPAAARAFLNPAHHQPCPAEALPGMEKALPRILTALQNHEKIGVWGDFDVDGQTSTAILVGGLRLLGADVNYHIPVRGPESHGLSVPHLEIFLNTGISLLITCDTGISANEAVEFANSKAVDVIVTDHHTLPDVLPNAFALIDSQFLPAEHSLATLSGSGVAYKVIEALFAALNRYEDSERFNDLAALGLIADVAELTRDARFLVQKGLARLRAFPRPGLAAILKENNSSPDDMTESVVSYVLAPRLNAVGRLADANPMVEFLLSDDPVFLATTCNQIEGLNANRKVLCDQVFNGAQTMLEQDPRLLEKPLIYLGHPDWPSGVVGIVASRLVELYHRPAILFNTSDPAFARGSARSVPGINIIAAIREQEALLTSCGGHPMAAGLSVSAQNFDTLKYGLFETITKMAAGSEFKPVVEIDMQIELKNLDFDLVAELQQLAPFGPGNPPVLFSAAGLEIESIAVMGRNSEHERLTLGDGERNLYKSLWWQSVGLPHPTFRFDLAFTASLKKFKGIVDIQLEWQDYRDSVDIESHPLSRKKSSDIENIDLRQSQGPLNDMKELLAAVDTLVFAESNFPANITSVTRAGLRPAQNLVLWTSPPSLELLHWVIESVKPSRICWVCLDPPENTLANLLKEVGKYVKRKTGEEMTFPLDDLAAACASTTGLVSLNLQWYAARGDISIHSMDEEMAEITVVPGSANNAESARLQSQISTAHAEVSAFRKYLHTAPNISALLPEKKKSAK